GMHVAPVETCDSLRLIECVADSSVPSFAGLSVFYGLNGTDYLVSYNRGHRKECLPKATSAFCTTNTADATVTVSAKVFVDEENFRTYRCEVHYFDTRFWKKTYLVNVTTASKDTIPVSSAPITCVKHHIDVISVLVGGGGVLVLMTVVQVVWACRRRLCRSRVTRRRKLPALPDRPAGGQKDGDMESALARRPPAELPLGACPVDYHDPSSTTYLTPVPRPQQPADLPRGACPMDFQDASTYLTPVPRPPQPA
ncbi:hypothetical protein BaRGS_00016626, partial [Batillaria attramentaria]